MATIFSKLISSGSYLPSKILTNNDIEKMVDTTDEWIMERTGIQQRHIASTEESSVDMAYQASMKAIDLASINKQKIDMIIVATTTPERKFPSSAVLLQNKLDIKNAFAFDVNAACTGFIFAIDIADKYIKNGSVKNVLVVGTEKITSLLDWTDRNTCVLFGDGAGSIILSASDKPGILSSFIESDGSYKDLLTVNTDEEFIEMKGNDVFKIAVNTLSQVALHTLKQNNINSNELDWFIPHQANSRIITSIAKKINLPKEKIIITVNKHGNTSAASIPLALDDAFLAGKIKQNDLLMLEAFGAGFTWGSTLLRFN
ncbi:MAG: 3-oxoacyl-ACP synthase [Gammaproteobacteria bacterium]|nr:3-oxoacyl-ACP synthase [Gammaproteobacteria bacterium]|tara:strand:+ start:36225 stop:37169 length:945 start_codon:yes stop_codon:yes gene_type:complete